MSTVEALHQAHLINNAFRELGGRELNGLERLESRRLAELSRNLSVFGKGPRAPLSKGQAAALVGFEALRSLHTMAVIMSAAMDKSRGAARVLAGFCGGSVAVTVNLNQDAPRAAPRAQADVVVCGRPAAGCFDPIAVNVNVTPGCEAARRTCDGVARVEDRATCGNPTADAYDALGGAGTFFEDRIMRLMINIVKEQQDKIEERLRNLEAAAKQAAEAGKKKKKKGGFGAVLGIVGAVVGACVGMPQLGYAIGSAVGGAIDKRREEKNQQEQAKMAASQESRNIEFEKIKFDMQKLSQMQQALSNIMNTMDELAKSAIRHIKA